MKLSKLIEPQFQASLSKLLTQEMPLRTAFSLRGIVKRVNDELSKYDEVRNQALTRLGDKDEAGALVKDERGVVKLSEDNLKTFSEEIGALHTLDVDVGQVKLAELGDKVSVTTADLMILGDLITE